MSILLPKFVIIYGFCFFGRHKNTLLHLYLICATLHISDKMNAGSGYAIPALGR